MSIIDILARADSSPEPVPEPPKQLDPLPNGVENFLSEMSAATQTTSDRLRNRAYALRRRAEELDSMADRLDKLTPDVVEAVESLVRYERESSKQATSLAAVNPVVRVHQLPEVSDIEEKPLNPIE